jgi:hypothetical protein
MIAKFRKPPDPGLVSTLSEMLEDAKAGAIYGFAAVTTHLSATGRLISQVTIIGNNRMAERAVAELKKYL